MLFVFFQAEDGIRDLVRSRGLGDVYKRQGLEATEAGERSAVLEPRELGVDRHLLRGCVEGGVELGRDEEAVLRRFKEGVR